MREVSEDKVDRILSLYSRLKNGDVIDKAAEIAALGIAERTLQRDIADIQAFLSSRISENGEVQEIRYDRSTGGYRLVTRTERRLNSREFLAVCEALLEGNSLVPEELFPILYKLLNACEEGGERNQMKDYLAEKRGHYTGPRHGKKLLDTLWTLKCAIDQSCCLKIHCEEREDQGEITETVQPVRVMREGEFYYLCAFPCGEDGRAELANPESPVFARYRVDSLEVLERKPLRNSQIPAMMGQETKRPE